MAGKVANEMQCAIDRFEDALRADVKPADDGYYYSLWWTMRGLVAYWLSENADPVLLDRWKQETA